MKDAGVQWADSVQFLDRQLAIFKSRNRMIHQYYPSPYDGPITFFRAGREYIEDPSAPRPEIMNDPSRGFATLTTQPIEIHMVPGNHHQLGREPGVQVVADVISAHMQKASKAIELRSEEMPSQHAGLSVG